MAYKLHLAEIQLLRRVKRCTRGEFQMSAIQRKQTTNKQSYKQSWKEHLTRMTSEHLPKKL
jgi:hypothetical protein